MMSPMQDIPEPVSILAVIVLYRMNPSESPAFRSLQASASSLDHSNVRVKILLYDNTPGGHLPGILPENTEYRQSPGNYGLASAYNAALQMATAEGFEWLLTLDQDTTVPESFLGRVASLAKDMESRLDVAGFVPEVVDHGTFISPHVLVRGRWRRLPDNFVGVPDGEISAINSGATWRTQSLRDIGGFNPLFWLDYLDHWLYREIQLSGKRICVVGDLRIEHELSLLSSPHQLTPDRLASILEAESAFYDLYKSVTIGRLLTMMMFARLSILLLKTGNRGLWRVIWLYFRQRVVCRRTTRILKWEQRVRERLERSS